MEFYQTSTTELLFKVYGAPLDDWANGGCVDGLLQVWWVGIGVSSLGSWFYFKECVWNLGTKLKWQQGSIPGI